MPRPSRLALALLALALWAGASRPGSAQQPIPARSYDRWMGDLKDEIEDWTPAQIVLPGAHDAGTYAIDEESPLFLESLTQDPDLDFSLPLESTLPLFSDVLRGVAMWSRTQRGTIAQQLDAGVRYLDLRFCRDDDGVHRAHHGMLGSSADEILAQIQSFAFAPGHEREVLVLEISHLCNFEPEDHRALAAAIVRRFGGLLVWRAGELPTFGTLWPTGRRIFVVYGTSPSGRDNEIAELGTAPFHYADGTYVDPNWFWPRMWLDGRWLNQQTYGNLLAALTANLWTRGPPDVFFAPSMTLTPDDRMVACDLVDRLEFESVGYFQYLAYYIGREIFVDESECDQEIYHSVAGIASQINQPLNGFLYDSWLRGTDGVEGNLNIVSADWTQAFANQVGAALEINRGQRTPELFLGYVGGGSNRLLSSVGGDYFGAEVLLPGAATQPFPGSDVGGSIALGEDGGCLYEAWVQNGLRLARSCNAPWEGNDWAGTQIPIGGPPLRFAAKTPDVVGYEACLFVGFLADTGGERDLYVSRHCGENPIQEPWPTEPQEIPGVESPGSAPALAALDGCLYAVWRGADEEVVVGGPFSPSTIEIPGPLFASKNCSGAAWDGAAWEAPRDLGVRSFSKPALETIGSVLVLAFRWNTDPRDEDPSEDRLSSWFTLAGDPNWHEGPMYDATTEAAPALTVRRDRLYLAWLPSQTSRRVQVASAPMQRPLAFEAATTLDVEPFTDLALAAVTNRPPQARCAPVATCADPLACNAAVSIDDGSFDPDDEPLGFVQEPPAPYGVGIHDVTLHVTDPGGASDSCSATITVADCDAPHIECPDPTRAECEGNEQAIVDPGDATAHDCTLQEVTDPGPASYPLGTTTVPYAASDAAGHTASCETTVTIEDGFPPDLACPADLSVACTESTEPSRTGVATAEDLCDPTLAVSHSDAVAPGTCASESTVTRTWSTADGSGNAASCDQTIDVVDAIGPTIACNAPSSIVPPDVPVSFTATASDDCCGPELEVAVGGLECFRFAGNGRMVDTTESCAVELDGATVTIEDSGGVGHHVRWTVTAVDCCGNEVETACGLVVVRPGQGPPNGLPRSGG